LRRRSTLITLTARVGDRPKARTEHLVSERVDDELVIYDQVSHVAHCLSSDAVAVWELCNGRLTETEIAHQLAIPPQFVHRAVTALQELGLLEEGPAAPPDYSRRQAAVKLARAGGAAFVASLVYSVDVGTAAAAASHLAAGCPVASCSSPCTGGSAGSPATNATCASGFCYCSTASTPSSFRCATGSSCSADHATCTTNSQCCGNLCSGGRCQPASPTC
jgi:hypothetical protein